MYIYFALRGTSCPEEVHNSKRWYIQPTIHMSELGNGSLKPANNHGSEFQSRFTLCSTLRWLTLANTFISARVLNSAVSRFPVHKNEEIRNFCCFKSLCFKVIYHKVTDNSYTYQIVPFKHMCKLPLRYTLIKLKRKKKDEGRREEEEKGSRKGKMRERERKVERDRQRRDRDAERVAERME